MNETTIEALVRKVTALALLLGTVGACIALPPSPMLARWVDVPLANPDAEAGDVSGWVPLGFHAMHDPAAAYQGEWYFAPDHFDEDYSRRVALRQTIELPPGIVRNVEYSAASRVYGTRLGYDVQTGREYSYHLAGVVGIELSSGYYGPFVIDSNWTIVSVSTTSPSVRRLWDEADKRYVAVDFHLYYYPLDYGRQPWAPEIEEWREWLSEPFAGMDVGRVRLELISTCTGDCGGDREVAIDEIIAMVSIALGVDTVLTCLPGDADSNGMIEVHEIVAAVSNALGSCNA